MRHICLRLIAASSLLLVLTAQAATRPRYGGTLRVTTMVTLNSLDPAESGPPDSVLRRNISHLIFDTLVVLDARGLPQPALATSWTAVAGNQRWHFVLRRGTTFSDGAPLTGDAVAASLRKANPAWKVVALAEAVNIELDSPQPDLPTELALSRNAVMRRDGKLLGTGPFVVSQWDAGKKLTLTARDDYWAGRAFLDSIEIEMSKGLREQMIALELGRADLIEVAPEQSRRAATDGRRVASSAPAELIALLFAHETQTPDESRMREALALSIDRNQLNRVLLQSDGEPAGGLLPNWMTGYEFLFPTETNLPRAKQLRAEVRQPRNWTLAYDNTDTLARVVAERIMLNARDAGLNIQPATSTAADIRLVRVPLVAGNDQLALSELVSSLGIPQPKLQNISPATAYSVESSILQSRRVVPILHLRFVSGTSSNLQNWTSDNDGSWHIPQVWLTAGRP